MDGENIVSRVEIKETNLEYLVYSGHISYRWSRIYDQFRNNALSYN